MFVGISLGTGRLAQILGSSGGGSIPSTGQYQVAANNFKVGASSITSTGTLNEMAARSIHPIAGRYSELVVCYHAWYFTTGATAETDITQWDIKKAALELGAATTPILFSGGRTKSVPVATPFVMSDAILPSAFGLAEFNTTNCASLWHRIEATAAVGGTNHWPAMVCGRPTGTFSKKYAQANTLNQVDTTGAMSTPTGATDNVGNVLTPLMILGKSVVGGQISVIAHGDSIGLGAGTGFAQSNGGTGLLAEALWNGGTNPIPGVVIAKISAQASEYATSYTYRKAMAAYANVVVSEFGTNDIQVSAATAATLYASNKLIWEDARSNGVQRVLQTKLMADTNNGHPVSALTQVGGVATCTIDDTSWMTGQTITIAGAGTAGYNLTGVTATVLNATQFTYPVNSGTVSPSSTVNLATVGDQYQTKLGQVPKTEWANAGGVRDSAHVLYAAAVPAGDIDAFPDTLTPVADAGDNHYWVTNGTVNYPTDDGVHPNATISGLASAQIYAALSALSVDQNVRAPVNLRAAGVSSVIPQEGVPITIDTYDIWKDIAGVSPTYQWKRGGVAINGATSAGYTPVTADVGTTLTREKTYTNSFGSTTMTTTVGGYVWAADGLTRFLSDAFNGTAASDLNTHTSDSGATWARNAAVAGAARITGPRDGRFYNLSTGTHYMASVIPGSANQTVYFTLDPQTTVANQIMGVMLRSDPTVSTGYQFAYSRVAGGWTISKVVTGTATVLATGVAAINNGQRYSVKCVASGTTLTMYVDGTQVATITDATVSAIGQIGLRTVTASSTPTTGLSIAEMTAAV